MKENAVAITGYTGCAQESAMCMRRFTTFGGSEIVFISSSQSRLSTCVIPCCSSYRSSCAPEIPDCQRKSVTRVRRPENALILAFLRTVSWSSCSEPFHTSRKQGSCPARGERSTTPGSAGNAFPTNSIFRDVDQNTVTNSLLRVEV